MKTVLKLTAIILIMAMLCACAAPAAEPEKTAAPAASAPAAATAAPVTAKDYFADAVHGDVNYADMEYVHYDDTALLERVDDITALADGPWDELKTAYEDAYAMSMDMLTQNTLISLMYYDNVNDDAVADEVTWSDTACNDVLDKLCEALRLVTGSACAEDFRALVGDAAFEEFADYEVMTDREKELCERESELELLYEQQIQTDYPVVVDGETWTGERFELEAYDLDYEQYIRIYNELDKAKNAVVGETYVELVAIRTELAGIYGVDSYADYAYEDIYNRDYTTDDIEQFRETIKSEIAPRVFTDVLLSDAFYTDLGDAASFTTEELLDTLARYLPEISAEMTEPLEYMREHGLCNIGYEEGMSEGGFTTTLQSYNAPFIYYRTYGDVYDLGSVVHEFGHYNDAYYNHSPNVLALGGAFDLLEIHSTGLEALFNEYFEEIYGAEAAPVAHVISLGSLLWSVVSGCIYDEFQQYVYDNPGLTLDEINRAYYEINASYGYPYSLTVLDPETTGGDYSWMNVSHNFSSPMYYISYATSAIASLEIWADSQTDRAAAVDKYLTLVSCGAYETSFSELLEQCGFGAITDGEHVVSVCEAVLDEIARQSGLAA